MDTKPKVGPFKLPNEVVYDGMTLNKKLIKPETIEAFTQMKTTEKDVFIASYPRAGSTWTSIIVHCLMFPEQLETKRSTFVKDVYLLEMERGGNELKRAVNHYGESRLLKTHMHARHLRRQIDDGNAKIIVLMRNPKDTLISFYHFYRLNRKLGLFRGTFDEFFELFKLKQLIYGDWLEYNQEFWNKRNNPNILILFYEEMVADVPAVIRKIGCFINKHPSEEQFKLIYERVIFSNLKSNPNYSVMRHSDAEDAFYRKGKVGQWADFMTNEQSAYIDRIYNDTIHKIQLPVFYQRKSKL